MLIQKIGAKTVKDSRSQDTIQVVVSTSKGDFITSAPSGKSTGKYEVKSYAKNLKGDISFINLLDLNLVNQIFYDLLGEAKSCSERVNISRGFLILEEIEKIIEKDIGGNSLFALEASFLKALAKECGKELWEFVGGKRKKINIRAVGNGVGGGLHSKGVKGKKPDIQEFLFIGNGKDFDECVKINKMAYERSRELLHSQDKNDEGGWETDETNEGVLEIMKKVRRELREKGFELDIGMDVAATSFYINGKYCYENIGKCFNVTQQVDFMERLIRRYDLFYLEDGLDEKDFSGFSEILKYVKSGKLNCLIVGDDLTTTNPSRFEKAIKGKSINAIIVKPNQIGSLLKVKEVIEIAKEKGIKTIISHRSGETMDNTIADLGVGFNCDFIKTGIYGKVRESKLDRIKEIERKIK
jgi:enolase